jgi:hypothetical protein
MSDYNAEIANLKTEVTNYYAKVQAAIDKANEEIRREEEAAAAAAAAAAAKTESTTPKPGSFWSKIFG